MNRSPVLLASLSRFLIASTIIKTLAAIGWLTSGVILFPTDMASYFNNTGRSLNGSSMLRYLWVLLMTLFSL